MYQLGMVAIGGGARPSMFVAPLQSQFHVGYSLGGPSLGVTAQEAYVNAKAAIADYDQLVGRAARIANKTSRDEIVKTYGLNEPDNKDKSLYMRNATASCVAQADAFSPVAYEQGFPSHGPCIGRVTKLQNFIDDMKSDVRNAENTYGILPEPVVITQYVNVPGQAAPGTTNWTIPIAVGVGGLAIAALLGAFRG